MSKTKMDTRFFESTRGQIVTLLRSSAMTVNDLAERLAVTDNAVRAHLLTLERDGLAEQKGAVKGFRKPHLTYGLTDEARHLFPKPYAVVVIKLIDVLKRSFSLNTLTDTLRHLGRDLGRENAASQGATVSIRVQDALNALEVFGGAPKTTGSNGTITITSGSCPFNELVASHPETCAAAEAMIEEIVGKPVTEKCDRQNSPKCCFVIDLEGEVIEPQPIVGAEPKEH